MDSHAAMMDVDMSTHEEKSSIHITRVAEASERSCCKANSNQLTVQAVKPQVSTSSQVSTTPKATTATTAPALSPKSINALFFDLSQIDDQLLSHFAKEIIASKGLTQSSRPHVKSCSSFGSTDASSRLKKEMHSPMSREEQSLDDLLSEENWISTDASSTDDESSDFLRSSMSSPLSHGSGKTYVGSPGSEEEFFNVWDDDKDQESVASSFCGSMATPEAFHPARNFNLPAGMQALMSAPTAAAPQLLSHQNPQLCIPGIHTGVSPMPLAFNNNVLGMADPLLKQSALAALLVRPRPRCRTCQVPGCQKAAQSKSRCKAHGGGQRCKHPGCPRSSQGKKGFCRSHGGGPRCQHGDCEKGAQRFGFCAAHGGFRECIVNGCNKHDRGGGFCAAHGGGRRCDVPNCARPARRDALCSIHSKAVEGTTDSTDTKARSNVSKTRSPAMASTCINAPTETNAQHAPFAVIV